MGKEGNTKRSYRRLLDIFQQLMPDTLQGGNTPKIETAKADTGMAARSEKSLLRKAYSILTVAYDNKSAKTGEPLVDYVLSLSEIAVKELNLGIASAISCLFSHADMKEKEIVSFLSEKQFRESITIIDGFQKISALPMDRLSTNADNYTGIMLGLAKDIRAILISMAENLYLLRNSEKLNPTELKLSIAKASNIFIPLSHKLGLYLIKSEMEEITFKLTEPDNYQNLAGEIESEVSRNQGFIQRFTEPIVRDMVRLNMNFSVKSRTKSVSSVHKKMKKQKVPFNEIYDFFAVRIIINCPKEDEKAECWKAYSVVTSHYSPEMSRMRDWITKPRSNGYESLHITVQDTSGRWVEVQIRSQRMDKDAESGTAAHWRYKGHKDSVESSAWMNSVRQILENPEYSEELLVSEKISSTISDNTVYVFTPLGDLIKIKEGATVLDFAFELHTAIGSRCTGGRVNHKIVPIRQKLKNGDIVEIITSKNQTPTRDWLNWVVTSRAKNKIRRHLKEAEFAETEVGKDILRRKLSQLKMPFNDENVSKLLNYFKYDTSLILYQNLAQNKIEPSQIKEILTATGKEPVESQAELSKETPRTSIKTTENTILVNESAELQGYILAQCCNPVMGDEIFGFIMTGGGIKIHRSSCPNAPRLKTRYPYRVMNAQWSKVVEGSFFISTIRVTGIDQLGILNSITELLSHELKVNVRNISLNSNNGKFEGYIKLSVRDSKHIDSLIKKIETLKGVTRVKRVH